MEGQNVQALERAFDVLETLSETHGGIGLSTLAQKTGLSKSTAHRILKTMLERGYAEKTLDGSYKLGSHLFELMSNHIDSLELQVEAQPYMAALERALHLPAYLGVLDGPYVSVIGKEATHKADEISRVWASATPPTARPWASACLPAFLPKSWKRRSAISGSKRTRPTPSPAGAIS